MEQDMIVENSMIRQTNNAAIRAKSLFYSSSRNSTIIEVSLIRLWVAYYIDKFSPVYK